MALFGLIGTGNVGNAGSAQAVLAQLSTHPGVRVSAICGRPDVVRERDGIPAVSLTWERLERAHWPGPVAAVAKAASKVWFPVRAVRLLRRLDAVVVPGMGVLEDTLPTRPWGMPYSLRCLTAAGRVTRTPVALVGVGATVSRNRLTRVLFRQAARGAAYRSFRDEESREAVRALGVDTSADPVVPDLAFALPVSVPRQDPWGPDEDTVVAVGVLAYRGRHEDRDRGEEILAAYTARVDALLHRLLDDGYTVRLVTGAPDDEPVATQLREAAVAARPQDAGRIVYERVESISDLVSQIARADAVVASRFHNVLCALRLARPTVSLGYAGKNAALMEAMGVGEFSRDVDGFDVDEVHALLLRALAEGDRLGPLLQGRTAEARRRLATQWADLDRLLGLDTATPHRPAPAPEENVP